VVQTNFGEMLREFRIRENMSQRTLAAQAGLDTSYISIVENGKRKNTSRSVALQIAEILKLSPDETDLWLISAGFISPRMQIIARENIANLMGSINRLGTDETD